MAAKKQPPKQWPARGVMEEYLDDAWLKEWVAFGLRALGAHLQRHAKYERWCAKNGRAA